MKRITRSCFSVLFILAACGGEGPSSSDEDVQSTSNALSGGVLIAVENQTAAVSALVAYGANGRFSYRRITGSFGCNNATFGDPIFGVVKACYVGWTWNYVGNFNLDDDHKVKRVAVCDRASRMYVLYDDGTLAVTFDQGPGFTFTTLGQFPDWQDITCGANLYILNSARNLYRMDTTQQEAPTFTYLGTPWAARQIAVAHTTTGTAVPGGADFFRALNDDGSMWWSWTGDDSSWHFVNTRADAAAIAVNGGTGAAILTDGDDLVAGDGTELDHIANAMSLTSDGQGTGTTTGDQHFYALNHDGSLYRGTFGFGGVLTTPQPGPAPAMPARPKTAVTMPMPPQPGLCEGGNPTYFTFCAMCAGDLSSTEVNQPGCDQSDARTGAERTYGGCSVFDGACTN